MAAARDVGLRVLVVLGQTGGGASKAPQDAAATAGQFPTWDSNEDRKVAFFCRLLSAKSHTMIFAS